MNNVLILASVASMIAQFNMSNIRLLKSMGYNVEVACNFQEGNNLSEEEIEKLKRTLDSMGVTFYQIDFSRSILQFRKNLTAFNQVKKILSDKKYDFLHCHSPIGGLIGRIAGKLKNVKVIYTAHGFHFYKGAPLKNWILFYPVEKICSYVTDVLLTINTEDYEFAKQHMNAKKTVYIPGIGIDLEKFKREKRNITYKRAELGLKDDDIVLFSVGELNHNKNHELVIKALHTIGDSRIHYLIAGVGVLKDYLQDLSEKYGLRNNVHSLGYRKDIAELCQISDLFVFPSLREGLPVSVMEAMASGLPIIASNIRGNRDLVENHKGGILLSTNSVEEWSQAIGNMVKDSEKRLGMSKYNLEKVQMFSKERVLLETNNIYKLL